MTWEEAVRVSHRLMDAGYSHTIQVGIHPKMSPSVGCRVDILRPPATPEGNLSEWDWSAMSACREIVVEEGAELYISSFDHKLYAGTPQR